jgi:hypothetical protein
MHPAVHHQLREEESEVAKINEKVMKLVDGELAKKPDTSTKDLFQKAKSAVPHIGRLSLRQFNARYPLQIKRRSKKPKAAPKARAAKAEKPARPARARRAAATRRAVKPEGTVDRDAIRQTFMRFASEVAAAKEPQDVFKLMAQVDKYVDSVVKAAGAR